MKNYPSIQIQGGILSADVLDKLAQGELPKQKPQDFGFEPEAKLRDKINTVWAGLQPLWKVFKQKKEKVEAQGGMGTSETRKTWMLPFLSFLDYDLETTKSESINQKVYPISHRDGKQDELPIHIVGFSANLDKRGKAGGPRMSPHGMVQEYLNLKDEHLYALVTNGLQLRLLRDSSRLVKLSYVEFDLERIMEEELFADFAVLYRLLHVSRMPERQMEGHESIIEQYHLDALESGTRIRKGLSNAVEEVLSTLGNGFLKHPENRKLREQLVNNQMTSDVYYQYLLKIVYRLLFLMVLEERDLIYSHQNADKQQKDIYNKYYSLARLRKLSEQRLSEQQKYSDLWLALRQTFKLFDESKIGQKLGIAPLAGDLFGMNAIDILANSELDNKRLLHCIRLLNRFENRQNKQWTRINYAALNVEEFGSVYEGLLEYQAVFTKDIEQPDYWNFALVEGEDRGTSGSHYTPEELVHPLIKHSLDHLIDEKLETAYKATKRASKEEQKEAKVKALLSLRVCDVACGSGHILLSAARRIATQLAKELFEVDQPSPTEFKEAIRTVIGECIFGVDKNPLAIELCKVALWLEAHNPGQPLNFLDHHIKCGDSIVGLTHLSDYDKGIPNEAFKTLSGDNKEVAALLRKTNKAERKQQEGNQKRLIFEGKLKNRLKAFAEKYQKAVALPEGSLKEIETKKKAFKNLQKGTLYYNLRSLADLQIAQFFIPKTEENQDLLTTDSAFREYLKGSKASNSMAFAKATVPATKGRFFHWFLEFPMIFMGENPGFDCILGNPPFVKAQGLSGLFGKNYLEYLKWNFAPAGAVDIVAYFFRRNFNLIKIGGFISLISTNTVAQGKAREGGLQVICNNNGVINHAVRSMPWPGLATVSVSLITIYNGNWSRNFLLDRRKVKQITSYLDDAESLGNPYSLKQNDDKSFQGSIVLGSGFILNAEKAQALIKKNDKNKEVLFPFLNGSDLNTNPDQSPSRWVINFSNWPMTRYDKNNWKSLTEEEREEIIKNKVFASPNYSGKVATDYPDCFTILEQSCKAERYNIKVRKKEKGKKLTNDDKVAICYWWRFLRVRPKLYSAIKTLKNVIVIALTSKTVGFVFTESDFVCSHAVGVIALENISDLTILQNSFHNHWAWTYGSTMKDDLRYTPSGIFQTFPFPQNLTIEKESTLEQIGEAYHSFRKQLMLDLQLGLTKTYNQFHNKNLVEIHKDLSHKEIEKQYGKESLYLWKHLEKTEGVISFNEAVLRIKELRSLHQKMDHLVLEAYGWHQSAPLWADNPLAEDPQEILLGLSLRHDFYEVEYLPEKDRIRYTIHPEARKEVLKRLLLLNHAIHAVEKLKEVNPEELQAAKREKKAKNKKQGKKGATGTGDLFGPSQEELLQQAFEQMVERGETQEVEFKSTLRYCLRQNSIQDYIEHSVIKTIAAFLNSNGGTLFIGISDEKEYLGLDNDYGTFKKDDKQDEFLKHFDNLMKNTMGDFVHSCIKVHLLPLKGKATCIIEVQPMTTAVIVKSKKKNQGEVEQFYIRRQASTIELGMSESMRYIKEKWG